MLDKIFIQTAQHGFCAFFLALCSRAVVHMIEHELPQLHHVRVHLLVHANLQIPLTVLDHRRHQRVNALAVRLTQAFP